MSGPHVTFANLFSERSSLRKVGALTRTCWPQLPATVLARPAIHSVKDFQAEELPYSKSISKPRLIVFTIDLGNSTAMK